MLGGSADGPALTVENGPGITYTVPQRIRPGNIRKNAEIFFRVNRVWGKSQILVTSGEQTIARFSRTHLAPGEMEHIVIPGALLGKASGCFTVSVEEAAT